ncbi:dynein light chain roadblock-type 1-like [Bombina bombina]|uniref:dynein light chain roadblock-type 1-like n=1 Tax=Bombina bombina TaxID=8345 RepID=UPI00235A7AC0|nr:dynein light chain roadblock-type 1-like [Bombina bombina]
MRGVIGQFGYSWAEANMADVEETLKRIQSQKGVQGIIIVNSEGIPIKSTLDNPTTMQYAGLMHQLVMKARGSIRDIDPQNDLTFLRIRSKKNEIMIAPGTQSSQLSIEIFFIFNMLCCAIFYFVLFVYNIY